MSAYDAETGKLDWRWYVVPGDPAKGFENPQMAAAAKTWADRGGRRAAVVGPGMPLPDDPQTDLVLIGTGNGAPWAERDAQQAHDNLYISSIVALHLDSGAYAWHYQTTPHDRYDFDSTQQITIADLMIGGVTAMWPCRPTRTDCSMYWTCPPAGYCLPGGVGLGVPVGTTARDEDRQLAPERGGQL